MSFDVGNFSEAALYALWEFKQCGASAIPDDKKCHKKVIERAGHVAEHVGKGVAAWKVGKVLGSATAGYLESHFGIPREQSQLLAETIIQAATMTALEAKHLKTVDEWAKKLITEGAAAFLGKTAHGGVEHIVEAHEARQIIQQAAPLLAGKFTGIGTAMAGGKLPGPGALARMVAERSAHDTKLLMDFFMHRTPAYAEETGAARVMAELAIMSLMTAYPEAVKG